MIFVLYLIFGQLESTKHPLRGCVCVGGGGGGGGGGGKPYLAHYLLHFAKGALFRT